MTHQRMIEGFSSPSCWVTTTPSPVRRTRWEGSFEIFPDFLAERSAALAFGLKV